RIEPAPGIPRRIAQQRSPFIMANAQEAEGETARTVLFHHGTDQSSANDLLGNGVNSQHAAAWNGSGEFWATTDHHRAEWFALSHPSSPPAACFEFDVPEPVLLAILQINPPAAVHHGPNDYE